MTRAGFVGLAGRPNVGKSTLVNAIVGAKVAIVSDRPQTTRRAIRGIATDRPAGWQMVLVDLPGVQRPRDSLTQRMQRRVERELANADAALLVVDGHQGVGPGDRFIAKALLGVKQGTPVVCVVNKCDRLRRPQTAAALTAAAELEAVDELFPISARTGTGLKPLIARLASLLPEGPFAYPPEDRSDLPSEVHLAELVREQVLRRTREEIPHAVEVAVEEVERRHGAQGAEGDRSLGEAERGLIEVHAQIWVETQSQKGILVGKGGRMVREIGTAARKELERDLGAQVFLNLQVKVREHWRRDEALLDRIGIE
jgi:GTP-binding protein Era